MSVILGIDLGTSSVKTMLLDAVSGVLDTKAVSYEISIPREGYAEQDPVLWWESVKQALHRLRDANRAAYQRIEAIGFSGQMHGLVMVDKEGNSLRPAIIWLDQRSGRQLKEIRKAMDEEALGEAFCNRVAPGFAFPSLLWIKENEPAVFARIHKIMMPKDYIRHKITGRIASEAADASASLLFDTKKRTWNFAVMDRFSLPKDILPDCAESYETAGTVSAACAAECGLPAGVPVVYGTGDQQAQSIGNGVYREGKIVCNIGTGGQISALIQAPVYDKKLRTHTFCHAIQNAYTIYGATLCSGMSLHWLRDTFFPKDSYEALSRLAEGIGAGSDGLLYLPYLSGERTPHMDVHARGMFFGMTLCHQKAHFVRAVMEGVAYSLRDSLEIFQEMGIEGDTVIASGGGAKSKVWLQILADIFQKKVKVCTVQEQACLGACIIAGVGRGIFRNTEEAVHRLVCFGEMVYSPLKKNAGIYEKQYAVYRALYPATCKLM